MLQKVELLVEQQGFFFVLFGSSVSNMLLKHLCILLNTYMRVLNILPLSPRFWDDNRIITANMEKSLSFTITYRYVTTKGAYLASKLGSYTKS